MTIASQAITLMSGSSINVQDIMYKNKIAAATNVVGVDAVPAEFHVAAIFRSLDNNEVLGINFYNEDFSSMQTLDWDLFGEKIGNDDRIALADMLLTALSLHKDAAHSVDAMNFTVVVRDEDGMEDVDFSDAVCVVEMNEIALAPMESLSEEDRNAIQQAAAGGGEMFDTLPILDKEVTLVAGKDFYQEISYGASGMLRLVILDGQIHLDPHGKFSKVEGESEAFLRLAVTDVAAGVEVRPICMR